MFSTNKLTIHHVPPLISAGFEAPKGVPTVFDPSFKGVGQRAGIEIWRIEKLTVVKKGASDKCYQGKFHTGDSYIILLTKVTETMCSHARDKDRAPRQHRVSFACVSTQWSSQSSATNY